MCGLVSWNKLSSCCVSQSLANGPHRLYTFIIFYYIHVLVTHTDHYQLQYRFHCSFCTCILPGGQCVWLKHAVENKNERVKFVWTVFASE